MSRRAPPPDRLACEAVISPEELIALRRQAAALGFSPDRWDKVTSFAAHWGTIAAVRLAERLKERHGFSEVEAQARSAIRLGISEETVKSRLRRWFLDSHGS